MKKRDFETYHKRFRDFEILTKFSETHVFRGTIRYPSKWAKSIPVFRPKRRKNHTLLGSTYLFGLYKGVPSRACRTGSVFLQFSGEQRQVRSWHRDPDMPCVAHTCLCLPGKREKNPLFCRLRKRVLIIK